MENIIIFYFYGRVSKNFCQLFLLLLFIHSFTECIFLWSFMQDIHFNLKMKCQWKIARNIIDQTFKISSSEKK